MENTGRWSIVHIPQSRKISGVNAHAADQPNEHVIMMRWELLGSGGWGCWAGHSPAGRADESARAWGRDATRRPGESARCSCTPRASAPPTGSPRCLPTRTPAAVLGPLQQACAATPPPALCYCRFALGNRCSVGFICESEAARPGVSLLMHIFLYYGVHAEMSCEAERSGIENWV